MVKQNRYASIRASTLELHYTPNDVIERLISIKHVLPSNEIYLAHLTLHLLTTALLPTTSPLAVSKHCPPIKFNKMASIASLPTSKRKTDRRGSAFAGEGHVFSTGKATATKSNTNKMVRHPKINDHDSDTRLEARRRLQQYQADQRTCHSEASSWSDQAQPRPKAFRGTIGRGQTFDGEVVGPVTRSQTAVSIQNQGP